MSWGRPAYATLSPATKIKLATLPKGELMLRHPHFTQPVFVRFPRPAVLSGREGVERFPPAIDLPFPDAVARQLRGLDRRSRRSRSGIWWPAGARTMCVARSPPRAASAPPTSRPISGPVSAAG